MKDEIIQATLVANSKNLLFPKNSYIKGEERELDASNERDADEVSIEALTIRVLRIPNGYAIMHESIADDDVLNDSPEEIQPVIPERNLDKAPVEE